MFDDKSALKEAGFEGFQSIIQLSENNFAEVPMTKGVYLVLRPTLDPPSFLKTNPAGRFKKNDPTVPVPVLRDKWVDGALVLYIGQVGGGGSRETLQKRIKTLVRFAGGKPVAHWGGRYLWQLKDSANHRVCWKTLGDTDPAQEENRLIAEFESTFGGMKPFANIK